MKKFFCFICLAYLSFPMKAQEALSLDSCRALAISNNKELLISQEKINAAHYQRKAAFTNYLPNISASGGYMRTQKELSILSDAQKGALPDWVQVSADRYSRLPKSSHSFIQNWQANCRL